MSIAVKARSAADDLRSLMRQVKATGRALHKSEPRKAKPVFGQLKPKKKRHKKHHALVMPSFEVLADGAHAVTIPVHTMCFVNGSQGWSRNAAFANARAKKAQREAVRPHLFGIGISFRNVLMVRLAPSAGLDTGNLWNALKAVQDEIAEHLGIDDGPKSPAAWSVGQERSKAYGVRVELRVNRSETDHA